MDRPLGRGRECLHVFAAQYKDLEQTIVRFGHRPRHGYTGTRLGGIDDVELGAFEIVLFTIQRDFIVEFLLLLAARAMVGVDRIGKGAIFIFVRPAGLLFRFDAHVEALDEIILTHFDDVDVTYLPTAAEQLHRRAQFFGRA